MAMFKLNRKDRAILRALEEDGRALIKDISKKTGIPRDSVNYRIKRMCAEGMIKGFAPICDTNKLGHPVYTWVCMELQQFDEKIERAFQLFLKANSHVIYIAKVTGTYHYIVTMATRTIQELDTVLRQILSKFPRLVKSYNTSLMIEEVMYDSFYRLIEE